MLARPPCYRPGMSLVRSLRATARLVLLVPVHLMPWRGLRAASALLVSAAAVLGHRGSTGGRARARGSEAPGGERAARGCGATGQPWVKVAHCDRPLQAQVAALLTEPDPSGRSFAPGVPRELAADYVEETAGWPMGAEVGRLLLLHLSTAPETAPVWAMWARD